MSAGSPVFMSTVISIYLYYLLIWSARLSRPTHVTAACGVIFLPSE